MQKSKQYLSKNTKLSQFNVIRFNFSLKISTNTSKQRLNYINKRNFFQNFKKTKNSFFTSTTEPGEEKYYTPLEPIVFENKRRLVSVSTSYNKMIPILEYGVFLPLMAFTGYKLFKSVVFIRPIRSIFWGVLFYIVNRYYTGLRRNKNFMIQKIALMDDGKNVEISTASGTRLVDIRTIRRISVEEGMYFSNLIPGVQNDFVPLVIDKEMFLLDKKSEILDSLLLNAISQGEYIDLKQADTVNKDDIIDI